MRPKISNSVRNEIVRLRIQEGYGRNEIWSRVRKRMRRTLSRDTVTNVLNEFYAGCKDDGIEENAKVYNLIETVEDLIEIATAKRENEVQTSEMILGAKIGKIAKEMKMDLSGLEDFIGEVFKRHKTEKLDVNALTKQGKEINDLERKHGKGFDDLKKEFESMGAKLPTMREEAEGLQEKSKTLKKENELLFKANQTTEKEVEEVSKLKRELKPLGLNLDDLKESKNAILNLKKDGQNPKEIVAKLKRVDDLSKSLSDLKLEIVEIRQEKTSLEAHIAKLDKELDEKRDLVSEVHKLEEAMLSATQIQKVRNAVVKIAAKHGKDPNGAFQAFESDVLNKYDALLGLGPEATSLEKRKENLQIEIQDLEMRIKRLQDAYSKQEEEIKAYNGLRFLNIDGKAIVKWEGIIKDAKLNAVAVERELRTNGDLAKLEAEEKESLEELEKRKKAVLAETKELEAKRSEIEVSIESIVENGINQMERMSEQRLAKISKLSKKVEAGITKLENEEENSLKRISDLSEQKTTELRNSLNDSVESAKKSFVDETNRLKQTSESFTTQLQSTLEKATPQIQTVSTTLDAGIKIGEFSGLISLIDLINGKDVPKERLIPQLHLIIARSKKWVSMHPLGTDITDALSKVEGALRQESISLV